MTYQAKRNFKSGGSYFISRPIMDYTRLFSFAYMFIVILLHVQSGVCRVTNCRDTQCTLTFYFVKEGDTPCNELRPSITDCDIGGPPWVFWRNATLYVEYLLVVIDAGPGGPWYCVPNEVWSYKWITPTWYKNISKPEVSRPPIMYYTVIPVFHDKNNPRHTFYVLLYYVRTFKHVNDVTTTITEGQRQEILYRAERNGNLSYTLAPYGVRHPEDLHASYHFIFSMEESCQRIGTTTTQRIGTTTTQRIGTTTTLLPSVAPSGSNARRTTAVVNVEIMFCVCMMVHMLLLCQ